MKLNNLLRFCLLIIFALFSYSLTNAQVVEKTKEDTHKAEKATVNTAKKTADVTKDKTDDVIDKTADESTKAADKTKDATVDATKATGSALDKAGDKTVDTTKDASSTTYRGGKRVAHSSWSGVKWVSKGISRPFRSSKP